MHQYKDCIKKSKERRITAASNSIGNVSQKKKQNLKPEMGRKTTVKIFQVTNKWNCTQENLDMAMKGKSQETKSFLIAAQKNVIRTNYIQVKTDDRQQNSKCWLLEKKIKALIT